MSPSPTFNYQAGDSLVDVREIVARDTFTPAEHAIFALLLATMLLLTWSPDAGSLWVIGGVGTLGILSLGVVRLHALYHPFDMRQLWVKWFLLMTPVWIMTTLYFLGGQNLSVAAGSDGFILLGAPVGKPSILFPRLGLGGLALFCGSYAVAVCTLLVPKSRAFFLRLFPWFSLNAVVYGLYGYALRLAEVTTIPGRSVMPETGATYFAHHPLPAGWLAFALLWTCLMIGLGFLEWRSRHKLPFGSGFGPWYLSGAALLIGSGGIVTAPGWANFLFWLGCALGALLYVAHLRASRHLGKRGAGLFAFVGAGLALGFAFLCWRTWSPVSVFDGSEHQAVWDMFRARPLWGWGLDSADLLFPLFVSDFFTGEPDWHNVSSAALALAMTGFVPAVLILLVPGAVLLHFISGRTSVRLSQHVLLGVGVCAVMALLTPALNDPLVQFSWWFLFFAAIRWADVTRMDADKVDTEPYLILSARLRREKRDAQEARAR